jgi:hypothetical protein
MLVSPTSRSVCALFLGVACLTAAATAETFKLELKQLPEQSRSRDAADALFRTTSPQAFYMNRDEGDRGKQRDEEFAGVIKKQPEKYQSAFPFRGVAKLGTQKFGWVLDSSKPKAGYDRLYFDANGNGDLTDDKVIEAIKERGSFFSGGYASYQFPRVDVTIDVDGKKLEYCFFASGYAYGMEEDKAPQYARVAFNAGVYRDGKITLDGKEHRIALLDFNSTGRFDDAYSVNKDVSGQNDSLYATTGDMLLVDPDTRGFAGSLGYDLTDRKERVPVSKLVLIGEKYYETKITPTGDEITLDLFKGAVASAVNANCVRYEAVVFGDDGMLKIVGEKDKPVALPVGEWRLFSYRADNSPPPKSANEPTAKAESKDGAKDTPTKPADKTKKTNTALSKAVRAWLGVQDAEEEDEDNEPSSFPLRPRYTLASGNATKGSPAFKVQEGRTTFMKFGPPYQPTVKITYWRDPHTAQLGLVIVGTGGEVLDDLMVDGNRPRAPTFQIISPAGEIILRGKFEFG